MRSHAAMADMYAFVGSTVIDNDDSPFHNDEEGLLTAQEFADDEEVRAGQMLKTAPSQSAPPHSILGL